MKPICESADSLKQAAGCGPSRVILQIKNIGHIPSKKNHHYPGLNGRILIDKPIKDRMKQLENAILSELYSGSQITVNETHSECLNRLRMLLSGLSDDSIREVPIGSWEVEYVSPGEEGLEIIVEEIK